MPQLNADKSTALIRSMVLCRSSTLTPVLWTFLSQFSTKREAKRYPRWAVVENNNPNYIIPPESYSFFLAYTNSENSLSLIPIKELNLTTMQLVSHHHQIDDLGYVDFLHAKRGTKKRSTKLGQKAVREVRWVVVEVREVELPHLLLLSLSLPLHCELAPFRSTLPHPAKPEHNNTPPDQTNLTLMMTETTPCSGWKHSKKH